MYVREMKSNIEPPTHGGGKETRRKECAFPKWKSLEVQVQVRILEQGAVPMSPNTISSLCKRRNRDPAQFVLDTTQFVLEQG